MVTNHVNVNKTGRDQRVWVVHYGEGITRMCQTIEPTLLSSYE